MKVSSSGLLASLIVTGMSLAASGRAAANVRPACTVLSLEEVRALVGAPVSVFMPDLSTPATRGDTTVSTCTYSIQDAAGHPAKGRSAKFTLMWAPKAKLSETNDFYAKRHIEASAVKGDVLVLAWVGNVSNGKAGDWAASQKLLAAVLQKL
jgi:hypothetical protein